MFFLQQSSDGEDWEDVEKSESLGTIKRRQEALNQLAAMEHVDLRIIAKDQSGKRIYPDCLYGGQEQG